MPPKSQRRPGEVRKEASARRRARNRQRGEERGHARVRARPILPGARYKLTRRCFERRLFLTPDSEAEVLRGFLGYCLGLCLSRYGLQVHAAVFMGNHYHLDVTDVRGCLPEFKSMFNSLVARGVNALRGRSDRLWSGDRPCDTRESSDEDTFGDLAYTLANPTKAELVRWGGRWEGLTTYGMGFGEVRRFKRPKLLFDEKSNLPESVELCLVRPQVFLELSDAELMSNLMKEVRRREEEVQVKLQRENRRFLGEDRVRRQHWNSAPRRREDRFKVQPKVAGSSRWAVRAALQRDRAWEAAYAEARALHLSGQAVEFPYGTYWMRRYAGVRVADAPP